MFVPGKPFNPSLLGMEFYYTECRDLLIVKGNFIILSVIMLSVIILSVVTVSVIMLNVMAP